MNTCLVDGIEYYISKDNRNYPIVLRVDRTGVNNQKDVLRKYLNRQGWSAREIGDKTTHQLAGIVKKLLNQNNELMDIVPSKSIVNNINKKKASNILITNEMIEKAHANVKATENYGKEDDLITKCFKTFPLNVDIVIVAMKVGLIDITNSTHVSQHKSLISVVELAECITKIDNIDERIKSGDPTVVNEIARCNGNINLFSFATKYCCYHNKNLYGRDDYSILDTVVKNSLPKYFDDVTRTQIQKWQDSFDYKSYNDYITRKLDELGINVEFRKRKFDHYIWFNNRGK